MNKCNDISFKYKNTMGLVSRAIPLFVLQDPPGHSVGQGFQVGLGSHHLKDVEKHHTLFSLKGLILT